MKRKSQNDTLDSMRQRLDELLLLQRKLRAELRELLECAADVDPMHEKAFEDEGPSPDDEEETTHRLDVMRRLSALNKEIISLMDQLPEYGSDAEDPARE